MSENPLISLDSIRGVAVGLVRRYPSTHIRVRGLAKGSDNLYEDD